MQEKRLKIKLKRIWEIDLLRALAVLGMVYFHFFYVIDYLNIDQVPLFEGGWEIFGNVVRNLFFIVVGIGMVMAWQRNKIRGLSPQKYYVKEIKKGLILIFLGGLATLGSSIFIPEQTIKFGVLSFIGASVLVLLPFVRFWWMLVFITLGVWWIEFQFGETWSQEALWAYVLGFYPGYWPSIDYFPLVPWVSAVSIGGVTGHLLFKEADRRYPFIGKTPIVLKPIVWIGQHALWIYVFHLPIIFLIIWQLEKIGGL